MYISVWKCIPISCLVCIKNTEGKRGQVEFCPKNVSVSERGNLMELEGLFTSSKWNILDEIAREPQSPMQLAEKLNTSIANISQQLRLLEAAGIVQKSRFPQRDRGKPRVIFSMKEDYGYLIAATNGYANKRLLALNDHHKFILKIWFIENKSLHEEIEEFYWYIKQHISKIKSVAHDGFNLYVLTRKGDSDISSKIKKAASILKKSKLVVHSEENTAKVMGAEELYVLHDPDRILVKGERGE